MHRKRPRLRTAIAALTLTAPAGARRDGTLDLATLDESSHVGGTTEEDHPIPGPSWVSRPPTAPGRRRTTATRSGSTPPRVPERTTGSVYGFRSADIEARDRVLDPPGERNAHEIRVEGERPEGRFNGVRTDDFTDTDPVRSLRREHTGIRNHGDGDEVFSRDVRARELPTGS